MIRKRRSERWMDEESLDEFVRVCCNNVINYKLVFNLKLSVYILARINKNHSMNS